MTTYSATINGAPYPLMQAQVEKRLDMQPGQFVLTIPYTDLHFGNYPPVQIFRDGQLYVQGSLYTVNHLDAGGPPTTDVVGYDVKSRLMRRFEKAGSSTVKYSYATEVSAFADIIASSAGMRQGQVSPSLVTFSHNFYGRSCADSLGILMFIVGWEAYVRNDCTVDFKSAGVGVNRPAVTLRKGMNTRYVRRTEDGLKVFNDVQVWYNAAASATGELSDPASIAQYGERDLPYLDLYYITDSAAVARYAADALADYKLPLKHSEIAFEDETVGAAYDVGDWIKVEDPLIGLSDVQRVIRIEKKWTPTGGETTVLLLSANARAWDVRRYMQLTLSDVYTALTNQMHELAAG